MLKIIPLEQTLFLGQRWLGLTVLTLNIENKSAEQSFCGIWWRKGFYLTEAIVEYKPRFILIVDIAVSSPPTPQALAG